MRTVIRNGRIATAGDVFIGDLSIVDGVIDEIGRDLKESYDNEINASGKLVIPGGVDVHTHFNLHSGSVVSCDDFFTGTRAAACGGTTTIVDHMGFGPTGCGLHHQLEVYRGYAEGNAVVDFGFHGVIQHVDDGILRELEDMVKIEGIPSFKIYMTYDFKVADSDALRIMSRLKELGGITAVHAENHDIISYLRDKFTREGKTSPIYHALSRPEECESEAVNRIISTAALAGDAPLYIVHLTTASGLQVVRAAEEKGSRVYAETCPQYLLLDESRYLEERNGGLKYIMSPPLRKEKDKESLWRGVEKGFIQVVATDHCPFRFTGEKQLGRDNFAKCPNGAPGVEERLPLLFSEGVMKGRISLQRFIEACCTNPARLFGLYPRKGTLAPGSDGDIVIMDTEREVTLTHGMLHGNADYTAYEGFKLRGYPVMTLSRGEVIAKEGEFSGTRGRGKFIKRVL